MGQRARREREKSTRPPIELEKNKKSRIQYFPMPQEATTQHEQSSKEKEKTNYSLESSSLSNIFQSIATQSCSTVSSELASNEIVQTNILGPSSLSTIHQEATVTQLNPSSKVNKNTNYFLGLPVI